MHIIITWNNELSNKFLVTYEIIDYKSVPSTYLFYGDIYGWKVAWY